MTTKLTREILTAALAGFHLEQQRIASQIAEVEALLKDSGGDAPAVAAPKPKGSDGKRSPAVRKRMADGQRARWAKIKGESAATAPEPSTSERAKRVRGRKPPGVGRPPRGLRTVKKESDKR